MTESAKPAPPCVFVIFGAAGDLTRRLLMPALYNLRRGKLLSDDFRIIGIARGDKSDEEFFPVHKVFALSFFSSPSAVRSLSQNDVQLSTRKFKRQENP